MKSTRDIKPDQLTVLNLRSISADLNQIRYWSATDDPQEERWDYIPAPVGGKARKKTIRTTERRGENHGSVKGVFIGLGVVAALALIVGAYFLFDLSSLFTGLPSGGNYAPVVGYRVQLGQRSFGVVENTSAIQAHVQKLQEEAGTTAGTTVAMEQVLTFEPVTIDAIYAANEDDVCIQLSKYATFAVPENAAPAATDPAATDPATTDPVTTDPATTDPATTDPATTDPATANGAG